MQKFNTGYNRYNYYFNLNEYKKYIKHYEKEKQKGGIITKLFINNGYAFEVKRMIKY